MLWSKVFFFLRLPRLSSILGYHRHIISNSLRPCRFIRVQLHRPRHNKSTILCTTYCRELEITPGFILLGHCDNNRLPQLYGENVFISSDVFYSVFRGTNYTFFDYKDSSCGAVSYHVVFFCIEHEWKTQRENTVIVNKIDLLIL